MNHEDWGYEESTEIELSWSQVQVFLQRVLADIFLGKLHRGLRIRQRFEKSREKETRDPELLICVCLRPCSEFIVVKETPAMIISRRILT